MKNKNMDKMKIAEEKISIKDILNKNFPSAICQHCKKVTNIQFSNDFRKLISRNRTLSEINKTLTEDWHKWMNIKNGQIEVMHKMTAEFIKLIPEESREKVKETTQEMRDEIKYAEKKFIGRLNIQDIQKVYKSQNSGNNNMYPGDPKGSPDESFSTNEKSQQFFKDTLVFIDEAFLSKLSKYFGNGKYIKFDRFDFGKSLSEKEKLNLNKIFFYIAPPFQSYNPTKDEEKKKEGYDSLVRKLREKGIFVREGRCQRLKCEDNLVYKQKAVDILLAMDLMSVPLKYPEIKRIILISSDSDFVPVVKNLEENGVRTILYTYYEKIRNTPFSVSNHLVKSVYKYVLLTKEDFKNSPLKKEVRDDK